MSLKKIENFNSVFFKRRLQQSLPLFVLLLPAAVLLFLFNYVPMYGVQIAFRDFKIADGITGSEWVGLDHFITFVSSPRFWTLIKNTLAVNVYSLIMFPVPIILALMLNYSVSKRFSKTVQMATYAPHFISVVVLVSMIELFFSSSTGIVNTIISWLGFEKIPFLMQPESFKHLFVWSGIWQSAGWSSIIYIGTLTTIPPDLHEAAIIDGATKMQRVWNIDIPGMLPTIITMFIMRIGQLMDLGTQKVLLMQNGPNITESEVVSTYVYKIGLLHNNFSYSAAIGLFNTVINIILLIVANKVCRKLSKTSLF